MKKILPLSIALVGAMSVCGYDITSKKLSNQTAYITSQCYTKTVDTNGAKHNPCYSCHINSQAPNYMSDEDLQLSYSLPEYATKNRWSNLFLDRTEAVANISDGSILEYIRQDNYKQNGTIILSQTLKNLPKQWDYNKNNKWDGYIPDCEFSFDSEGFDRKSDGKLTGWRAFKYRPFLGTFWPTNGSTDDVLIRLPRVFWKDIDGKIDIAIYKHNLDIVLQLIQNHALDLEYVGLAKAKNLKIAPGLYPVGTEFLHTVRYIDTDTHGNIKLSPRIKELRYAKKHRWAGYFEHQNLSDEEYKENHDFPDRYAVYHGDMENGISNKRGWFYQGFIEDSAGELRPQSYEETLYCIGCHANIGAITDSTFALPRLYEWGYWDEKGLKGVIDKKNEYTNYLKNNNHANEFRTNEEVYTKFFHNGTLKKQEASKIKHDISYLLYPSKQRALKLNKAYKVIVEEQSYIYGREPHIKPLENVHQQVQQDEPTYLEMITK